LLENHRKPTKRLTRKKTGHDPSCKNIFAFTASIDVPLARRLSAFDGRVDGDWPLRSGWNRWNSKCTALSDWSRQWSNPRTAAADEQLIADERLQLSPNGFQRWTWAFVHIASQ